MRENDRMRCLSLIWKLNFGKYWDIRELANKSFEMTLDTRQELKRFLDSLSC